MQSCVQKHKAGGHMGHKDWIVHRMQRQDLECHTVRDPVKFATLKRDYTVRN